MGNTFLFYFLFFRIFLSPSTPLFFRFQQKGSWDKRTQWTRHSLRFPHLCLTHSSSPLRYTSSSCSFALSFPLHFSNTATMWATRAVARRARLSTSSRSCAVFPLQRTRYAQQLAHQVLTTPCPISKSAILSEGLSEVPLTFADSFPRHSVDNPARPALPLLVPPSKVPNQKQLKVPISIYLLHSLAHIEVNAIGNFLFN